MATGFLHPGAMGASLATVCRGDRLWCGNGRSDATRTRAEAAGMEDVGSLEDLIARADVIVSVCPPGAAVEVAEAVSRAGFDGTYVDANAIAPTTARSIAARFTNFVDGGVVGPPVQAAGTTRLYLSGDLAHEVAALWKDTLLETRVVDGGAGAASAVKVCFAAWTKGTAALLLAIRALAAAENVEDALLAEWVTSQPGLDDQACALPPAMLPRRGALPVNSTRLRRPSPPTICPTASPPPRPTSTNDLPSSKMSPASTLQDVISATLSRTVLAALTRTRRLAEARMRTAMDRLDGKVAIVTGSSSGIGEATARRLADLGARVVVNSSSSVEAGTAVADSLPTESLYVQADISDQSQGHDLIARTVDRFGRLDILVNNAGWTTRIPHTDLDALTDEIFRKTFEVNVFGTWWLTKAAMPHLRESTDGNVVTITSIAGLRPIGSSIAYAMSKATLNHMTALLAKACGPVRVNAVAPGLVATPWTSQWEDQHAAVAATAPLRRSATPDDCAEAVIGLLRSSYVTGHVVVVDGGTALVI